MKNTRNIIDELKIREDRIKYAIEKGITCNEVTGKIYGITGKEISSISGDGYIIIRIRINNKICGIRGHQFIWYVINGNVVDNLDHINGNKTDNRIDNLRSVTHQHNQFNRTQKSKGYSKTKYNSYRVCISLNKKQIHIGTYKTTTEAREAYLNAKKIYHNIDTL